MALENFTVPETATLLDAVEVIDHNHCRCAMVMRGEKVVGIISEGDIMRTLLGGVSIHSPLAERANPSFKFLEKPDDEAALRLFREHGISLVPVVDNDMKLTDVVTLREVLERVVLSR